VEQGRADRSADRCAAHQEPLQRRRAGLGSSGSGLREPGGERTHLLHGLALVARAPGLSPSCTQNLLIGIPCVRPVLVQKLRVQTQHLRVAAAAAAATRARSPPPPPPAAVVAGVGSLGRGAVTQTAVRRRRTLAAAAAAAVGTRRLGRLPRRVVPPRSRSVGGRALACTKPRLAAAAVTVVVADGRLPPPACSVATPTPAV
jgi:hypothetical protein